MIYDDLVNLCLPHADQADQCDKDSFVIITASLVNDIHNLLKTLSSSDSRRLLPIPQTQPETIEALKNLDTDSIVLVAHSAGGVTAVDMLTGTICCYSTSCCCSCAPALLQPSSASPSALVFHCCWPLGSASGASPKITVGTVAAASD